MILTLTASTLAGDEDVYTFDCHNEREALMYIKGLVESTSAIRLTGLEISK